MEPRTLFDKIWDSHVVAAEPGYPSVLYVDLHLIHEVTSPQAFQRIRNRGLGVRRPDKTVATMDHVVPTVNQRDPIADPATAEMVNQLEQNCREFGIRLFGIGSPCQGIIHVIAPELGLTQPGLTIVCGDSHTATHGAFGSLAFGIGTSEVEHVLATQCLLQNRPRTIQVRIEGRLLPGVAAKDIILTLIAAIGVGGATGHVIEYSGSAIRSRDIEERMTVCNMSIEAGARAGMIAPDDVTFQYLSGRPFAPSGKAWEAALNGWRQLQTDAGAELSRIVELDASVMEPMVTYGTDPGMGIPVTGLVPEADPRALAYMGLRAGQPIMGLPIQAVFIGSCTNSRLSDLRAAATIFKARKVHPGVRVLVVPGSQEVKAQAEREGLDRIFATAGVEWREPGCSMCIAMNGDELLPGQYCVSTSNRNFEGRQGKDARTLLASPLTAAASAVCGSVADPRRFLQS